MLANQALSWMASGVAPEQMGNGQTSLAPYQSLPTADRDLTVAVGNGRQFARLCSVLDVAELAADARFASAAGRVTNRGALIPAIVIRTVLWTNADLPAPEARGCRRAGRSGLSRSAGVGAGDADQGVDG